MTQGNKDQRQRTAQEDAPVLFHLDFVSTYEAATPTGEPMWVATGPTNVPGIPNISFCARSLDDLSQWFALMGAAFAQRLVPDAFLPVFCIEMHLRDADNPKLERSTRQIVQSVYDWGDIGEIGLMHGPND